MAKRDLSRIDVERILLKYAPEFNWDVVERCPSLGIFHIQCKLGIIIEPPLEVTEPHLKELILGSIYKTIGQLTVMAKAIREKSI